MWTHHARRKELTMDIGKLVREYLGHIQLRLQPCTFIGYSHDLNLVIGRVHLVNGGWPRRLSVQGKDLDEYVRGRVGDGVSHRKINLELGVLKAFLNFLAERGLRVAHEALTYPLLKHVPKKERRALGPEEVARLLKASCRYRDVWAAFLYTGCRKSELLSLRVTDWLKDQGLLMVRDAKRKERVRAIPVHPALKKILLQRIASLRSKHNLYGRPKDLDGSLLFPCPSNLLRVFKKDIARAKIEPQGVDIHSLRVTFVTGLAEKGVNPRTVQELAGHSNVTTTLRFYLKVRDGQKDKAIRRLSW